MSSPAAVFRARQPELIATHVAARAEARAAYNDRLGAFLAETGSDTAHGIHGFDGSFWVLGYNIPSGSEPRDGWRRDSKKPCLAVPAKKTPEGRRIANEVLPNIGLAGEVIPGAPDSIRSGTHRVWPRLSTLGAEQFLVFSMVPDKNPVPGLDLEIWEPVKLSAYHAAAEAAQEAAEDA